MTAQTITNLPSRTPPGPMLPPALVGDLAGRLGPLGLFLLALRGDGSVAAYDQAAGPFFLRYALPLVQSPLARHGGRDPSGGPAPAGVPSQVRALPEGLLL